MTRNKHFRSVIAALLCAMLCMTAFATVAYADGGDYYDDELPPETWQEDTQPEDTTIVPGTPFTEDGIAATRDLLYDKHTNKQFITVETRNGHTLYIVIDYDKLLDEEEERYQTYVAAFNTRYGIRCAVKFINDVIFVFQVDLQQVCNILFIIYNQYLFRHIFNSFFSYPIKYNKYNHYIHNGLHEKLLRFSLCSF